MRYREVHVTYTIRAPEGRSIYIPIEIQHAALVIIVQEEGSDEYRVIKRKNVDVMELPGSFDYNVSVRKRGSR